MQKKPAPHRAGQAFFADGSLFDASETQRVFLAIIDAVLVPFVRPGEFEPVFRQTGDDGRCETEIETEAGVQQSQQVRRGVVGISSVVFGADVVVLFAPVVLAVGRELQSEPIVGIGCRIDAFA